jgi:PKHD-type hydroxylase
VITRIAGLLCSEQLGAIQTRLSGAGLEDGRTTREAGAEILRALEQSALFISAALPRHVFPPLFSRYRVGMGLGAHVEDAVRQLPGTAHRLRTDLSATVFLSAPEEYDGGELIIRDAYGEHSLKLAAGDLVVYPAGSLDRVQPVTRGVRTDASFWIQSMVRDAGARTVLFDLDTAIRDLTQAGAPNESLIRLTGCYHNLLRRWAQL